MAASEENTEVVMDLDDAENEERNDDHHNVRADESWTDFIRTSISEYTTPLVERYQGRANVEMKEKGDSDESFVGSMYQTLSGRASPVTERSDQIADEANANDDADDGILQKIANLASPIAEFIEDYTGNDVTEPPKENFLQKVAGRFDKKVEYPDSESTWNYKVLNTITRVTSPFMDRFEAPEILNEFDIREMPRNQALVGIGGLILVLLLSMKCCFTKRKQPPANRRPWSPTPGGARARARSGSLDVFLRRNSRDRTGTADDPLEAALRDIDGDAPLALGGPGVPSISYETWSPPMQWSDASRMLLPVNTKPDHQRNLTLNFQTGTLTREDKGGGRSETFDIRDVSLHVKPPAVGGVLQLYMKGTPEDQWLEHTFASAHQAAQFQQDVIHFQVVGPVVTNMYESLELIQKGSLGHDGKECVLHDDTSDTKKALVAWDDCMRCFCGIPALRKALDSELVHRIIGYKPDGEETAVPEDYVGSRLLLGRFHFFRLFVPYVEPTALPELESSPERVTELLERRKRVAQAAMLVEGYVQARTVANKGWNLSIDLPEETLTKRLAYDEDIDNVKRDSQAKNEYYEATVSRDIRCEVHSSKHLEKPGSSVLSKYQAFSLVASQVFKLPHKGERHPLSHRKDPVLALPSLQKMVVSYPQLDFFVCSFFPAGLGVAIVHVFVRSLPKGIDSSFDTVVRTDVVHSMFSGLISLDSHNLNPLCLSVQMDRFMNGTVEVRQRKLECFMQLGPGARLSPLAWGALKTVSMLLSWSRRGEAQIPYDSGLDGDRTPFPGMTMSNYMEVSHFGGSLQTDKSLPKNYVSVTAHVDPSKMNPAMRVLYQRLEEGGLQACIVDFTFVLEGEQVDELPERALGSIRIVHLDATKIALPTHYSASQGLVEDDDSVPEETQRSTLSPLTKTMSVVWNSLVSGSSRALGEREQPQLQEMPQTPTNGRGRDPFQMGIDALRDVLSGVTVPVRRENLSFDDMSIISESNDAIANDGAVTEAGDLVNVPVLSITSTDDLRRYLRATGCDLKEASVRIVENAAWRGVALPIDTRLCRVELQSGQFFQQGRDVDGDPVFYFQNMLMGPWRGDVNASVAAILYRLESSLNQLADEDPDVRYTVIALVGKPFKRISRKKKRRKGEGNDDSSAVSESKDASDGGEEETSSYAPSVASHTVDQSTWNPLRMGANPRLYPEEDFHVHSNILMFQRLAELLPAHYPERLKRLILVPGQGRSMTYVNTTFAIRKFITCSRIRNKVIHLNRASELPKYVEDSELCTIVGGNVQVLEENAFEC